MLTMRKKYVYRNDSEGRIDMNQLIKRYTPKSSIHITVISWIIISLLSCIMIKGDQFTAYASIPVRKDRAYFEGRGDIVWEVPAAGKRIALTFDDGPDPYRTPQILDVLKQYGAKATFFVVGWRAKVHAQLIQRMINEGHEIANHTYHHTYLRKTVTNAQIKNEIMKAHRILTQVSGVETHLFRPPGGYYHDRLVKIARENGYHVILWSWHQDTKDWCLPGVKKIVNQVLNHAQNGDIVLLHDFVDKGNQTVEAIKMIIPLLKNRGYDLVTVSKLMVHPRKGKRYSSVKGNNDKH